MYPSLAGSQSSASSSAAALLERVRDVLQEQQPEHEVLVLGRLDRSAQLVRRLEQRRAVRAVPVPLIFQLFSSPPPGAYGHRFRCMFPTRAPALQTYL